MRGYAMRGYVRGVVGLLLVIGVLALPSAALAQQPYPPPERPDRAQCPPNARAGDNPRCVAQGFAPGADVQVVVQGEGFRREFTVTANAGGVAAADFQVPCPTPIGSTVTVTFTGEDDAGGQMTVSDSLTVRATAPGCQVPATGADITNGLAAAAAAIIAGVLLLGYARRRRGRRGSGSVRQ